LNVYHNIKCSLQLFCGNRGLPHLIPLGTLESIEFAVLAVGQSQGMSADSVGGHLNDAFLAEAFPVEVYFLYPHFCFFDFFASPDCEGIDFPKVAQVGANNLDIERSTSSVNSGFQRVMVVIFSVKASWVVFLNWSIWSTILSPSSLHDIAFT
jgi:hypothetical protein